jgi:hypothetical protein
MKREERIACNCRECLESSELSREHYKHLNSGGEEYRQARACAMARMMVECLHSILVA